MSHNFEEKLYQDITDVGGFPMAKAVKTWHHQELQKAREEEKKRIVNEIKALMMLSRTNWEAMDKLLSEL